MSIFRSTRELPAPPEAVFAAMQDPARLARWWGPAGFSNVFERFEFWPGGAWVFVMRGPDGTEYPNQSAFVDIRPGALLQIRHLNAPLFTLTITLTPSARGTLLSWEQVFDDAGFAEGLRQFLEQANAQNLDRLTRELGLAP